MQSSSVPVCVRVCVHARARVRVSFSGVPRGGHEGS